jgi:hypothetical protein
VWYGMLNTLGIFDVSSLNPVQEHFHPPRPGIILPGLSDVHALQQTTASGR